MPQVGDRGTPGHLQQLRIGGPDAAQQIGIEDRQDDQEGDQHRQILGGKQDQRQNDKREATGMDLMSRRAGASSSSTRRNRADRAASRAALPAGNPL